MSWLRFGISAFAAAVYLLPITRASVAPGWQILVAGAFLYAIPHVFVKAGRPTRGTRLRILAATVGDFALAASAVYITGGIAGGFTWLFQLVIIANVLRYGDVGGALTAGGSMLAYSGIILSQGTAIGTAVPALVSRLGSFWVIYLMVAYLGRYATRMERVAHRGAKIMEAIGRIGVPVNLAGNVALALEAVCQEISILFTVDHVFIWLVENDGLAGVATTGAQKEAFHSLRHPLTDSSALAVRVVRERRPMFLNHAETLGDGPDADLARTFDIRALAGIPLIHGEAAVGVMMLADAHNPERFHEEDLAPAMLLGNLAATALYHASMHDQLRQAYTRTLETLGEAIDVRDAYTGGHSMRIAHYADEIARELGVPEETMGQIRTAALLHDIGKIGIPDRILLKPGPLTLGEMDLMKNHSSIGARLLETGGFATEIVAMVRYLHEHFDGTGYPDRLVGESIPLGSRILAVADAFEAMTSDRVYRPALARDTAVARLRRYSGTQFDPAVVEAFVARLATWPRLPGAKVLA